MSLDKNECERDAKLIVELSRMSPPNQILMPSLLDKVVKCVSFYSETSPTRDPDEFCYSARVPADPTPSDCQNAYRNLIITLEDARAPSLDFNVVRAVQMWARIPVCDKFNKETPLRDRRNEYAFVLQDAAGSGPHVLYNRVIASPNPPRPGSAGSTMSAEDVEVVRNEVMFNSRDDLRALYPLLTWETRARHWFSHGKWW